MRPKIDFYNKNNITNIDKVLLEIENGTYITSKNIEDYGDFEEDEVPEWVYTPRQNNLGKVKRIQSDVNPRQNNLGKVKRIQPIIDARQNNLSKLNSKIVEDIIEKKRRLKEESYSGKLEIKELEQKERIKLRDINRAKIKEVKEIKNKLELSVVKTIREDLNSKEIKYKNTFKRKYTIYDPIIGIRCTEENLNIIMKNIMENNYDEDDYVGNISNMNREFNHSVDIYECNKMVKYYREQRYNKIWDEDFLWDDEF